MAQYEVKKKFAWRPILTTSGKWIWWRDYVKLMKIYWGIAGESLAVTQNSTQKANGCWKV